MFRCTRFLKAREQNFIGRPELYPRHIFYEKISELKMKTPENYYGKLKTWTKPEIDETVLDMLYDYAQVPSENVTLEANIPDDLLVDSHYRFGLQEELQEKFQFRIPELRFYARDLQSGREAADWVAAVLDEFGRLNV